LLAASHHLGGIIHTYQKYDPKNFPSPTQPPPDMVSPAFEHMLHVRQHAAADRRGTRPRRCSIPARSPAWGPSLDALIAMLLERKRKILEKYETHGPRTARKRDIQPGSNVKPPPKLRKRFSGPSRTEQLRDLERLWYSAGDERSQFARQLVQLVETWATSTRSTNWRPSTSSPAARR
jgi:hypothetical protein